jgi:hypothetical protein
MSARAVIGTAAEGLGRSATRFARRLARRALRRFAGLPGWLATTVQAIRSDPNARERASAAAAFALIFSFGMASLDYLITGGPDWNPGAIAAPLNQPIVTPLTLAPTVAVEPPPTPPMIELAAYESIGPIEELLGGPEPAVLTAAVVHEGETYERSAAAFAKPANAMMLAPEGMATTKWTAAP